MPTRLRKLIGAIVFIVYVPVYALVAMALAQARAVQEAPGYALPFIYAVLGLVWILPLMPLIKWMEGGRPSGD